MRRASLVCLLLVLALGACAPESPTAFVLGNLELDATCVASDTSELYRATGVYDISAGGPDGSTLCDVPYRMMLKINSSLRPGNDPDLGRAEPNYLRVHSAEIKLMNLQRQPLGFEDEGEVLPNPFLVTTGGIIEPASSPADPASGIAAVEVIPIAYAPYLAEFSNDQILAEVQLFGTTTGDVDVDFQPFTYPIEICDGCLTVCESRLAPTNTNVNAMTREELAGGRCDNNSGSDGHYCVDPGC